MAISKIITSSLTDDAVTSAKIGTDQVGADALSSSAISGAVDIPANSVGQSELSIDLSAQSVPHIIPGVLYPSYVASGTANKLLDGTTDHSGAFGTEQSDGRKYYYTNIAGSKPIKDPRIGAHFGSQRHKFKSLQLLEQETATHGSNVYTVDGREWIRAVGDIEIQNEGQGLHFNINDTTTFFEITGYFNQFNWLEYLAQSGNARNRWTLAVDGTTTTTESSNAVSVDSPLAGRYVEAHSLRNINTGLTTPRIVTIKMTTNSAADNAWAGGCELIAQDITSTANRSKIQIPAQNVVSFGKKFPISATAVHYDPFTTMSYGGSGTTASALANLIDTATSLGMDNWKAGGDNFHRPWNGGRVIKWVDSDGTIKTSVNMMPPNAQNIGTTASNAVSNTEVEAGTNGETINFNTSAIDHSQSEVARTFHWREFGNGSANGGPEGTYADASMLSGNNDDIAYVMDDGTTSLSANAVRVNSDYLNQNANPSSINIAFIGTGISEKSKGVTHGGTDDYDYVVDGVVVETYNSSNTNSPAHKDIAQNLPYGSHVLKIHRTTASSDSTYIENFTFHQPKRPPIPEDCVVLADYMLMADHVNKTSHTNGVNIGKGVRLLDCSRDIFHDTSSGSMLLNNASIDQGYPFRNYMNSGSGAKISKVSAFGTSFGIDALASNRGKPQVAGSDVAHTDVGNHVHINSAVTLGNNLFGWQAESSQDGGFFRFEIATPIHTSHHYQAFETPLLHELVGGDRNMEQTNLVCSPDGKTWDEVTRNTSYIGNNLVAARVDQGSTGGFLYQDTTVKWDLWRGRNYRLDCGNKDSWAIAYDRMICLKDGEYTIIGVILHGLADRARLVLNGSDLVVLHETDANDTGTIHVTQPFRRGDYIYFFDSAYEQLYSHFQILKA